MLSWRTPRMLTPPAWHDNMMDGCCARPLRWPSVLVRFQISGRMDGIHPSTAPSQCGLGTGYSPLDRTVTLTPAAWKRLTWVQCCKHSCCLLFQTSLTLCPSTETETPPWKLCRLHWSRWVNCWSRTATFRTDSSTAQVSIKVAFCKKNK